MPCDKVKRLIAPAEYAQTLRNLPGLLDFASSGRQATAVVSDIDAVRPILASEVEEIDLNLDEIFEAYVIGRKEDQHAQPDLERVA